MTGLHWRVAALAVLLVLGALWAVWRPVSATAVAAFAAGVAGHPAGIAALIGAQALLFALALPGSLVLWAVAPFHGPVPATAILVAGSVAGALGGYAVAGWLGAPWRRRLQASPAYRLLARNGGLLAQCALRALPGFPHSVVNYGAGLLRLPLPAFTGAAIVGLALKWWVYAGAVRAAVTAGAAGELWRPDVAGPLAVAALLLGAGAAARAFWLRT